MNSKQWECIQQNPSGQSRLSCEIHLQLFSRSAFYERTKSGFVANFYSRYKRSISCFPRFIETLPKMEVIGHFRSNTLPRIFLPRTIAVQSRISSTQSNMQSQNNNFLKDVFVYETVRNKIERYCLTETLKVYCNFIFTCAKVSNLRSMGKEKSSTKD